MENIVLGNCCGLISKEQEPVPLKSIEVEVKVKDHVATVISMLQYVNNEENPIEAFFVFPLPGDAAVCQFSAKIGETEVVAEVQEKKQAREQYDDAISSGQQAFLLEESDESPDVFSLNVGCLPPKESASIRLEYVTELAVQADDSLRFCLPAVLNPRYRPQGSEEGEGGTPGGASTKITSVPASLVPYILSIAVHLSSPRPICKIESNCPLDPLQYLNTEQTQATVSLAAGHKFDRDVELLIYYKDAHQPVAVVEAGEKSSKPGSLMGDPVVMLSIYPEFPPSVTSSLSTYGEFLFLVDRSGSMESYQGRGRIDSARDTLLLLLKSLPLGCYFNIYGFGSTYEHIFPESVEYNEETMAKSLKEVEGLEANLGGTEILEPLKHIYKQPCIPGQPRQLFIFTDGEVSNTKKVLDLVKKNAGSHRCFSFGIGEGASTALINGLAREGGGHAQFISDSDRMQPKVMQSLQFALQPVVTGVSLKWDLPTGMTVTSLSPPITNIFHGQRSLLYAQLSGENLGSSEGMVTLQYNLNEQPCEEQLKFTLKASDDTGMTVHRLGARTLIRNLEMEAREQEKGKEDDGLKAKMVELSVQSGVSSTFTAFIAVYKGDRETTQRPLLQRNVPTPRSYSRFAPFRHCAMAAPIQLCSYSGSSDGEDVVTIQGGGQMQPLNMAAPKLCSYSGSSDGEDVGRALSLARCMMRSSRVGTSKSGGLMQRLAMAAPKLTGKFSLKQRRKASSQPVPPPPQRGDGYDHYITADGQYKEENLAVTDCGGQEQILQKPKPDLLMQVIALQKASGSWLLQPSLAEALGITSKDMANSKPSKVNDEVWATILALVWLHGFKMEVRVEWEILAMKAVSWLKTQKVSCVPKCVEAGNKLLGCKVQKDELGL